MSKAWWIGTLIAAVLIGSQGFQHRTSEISDLVSQSPHVRADR